MEQKSMELEEINYDIVECKENVFSEEAKEKIADLLTIRRDGNIILLCHPRHVFEMVSEDFNTKVIGKVDWNSINIERMEKYNDYGKFSMVSQCIKDNQFRYLKDKARHMIKKYKDLGIERFSFPIAIVEGVYDFSSDDYDYYARGIICITKNGFALGKNPNYNFSNHKESIWEKSLRMGDN